MEEAALSVDQLTVTYDKNTALWDVSLEIPQGVIAGVIGPNGAGKSTLIKAAMQMVKPVSGKILFSGKSLKDVRRSIAYVPQRESVDWDFPITVEDLVLMGSYTRLPLCIRPGRKEKQAAHNVLEKMGLFECRYREIHQLSGGQQQRAFIARALLQDADLYLMDEPFAGIDMCTEKVLIDVLRDLREQGKTILVVHHDLNSVQHYFDWIVMLNLRLVASGKTSEVFNVENISDTYGKAHALLGEAITLSKKQHSGLIDT